MSLKGTSTKTIHECYHCGTECASSHPVIDEKHFCCEGCKWVYELLDSNELCNYYNLNEHPGLSQKFTVWRDKFVFLDLPEIRNELVQFSDDQQTHLHLHLPQIHCSSCLWLLENLYRLDSGIGFSRVSFAEKKIHIIYEEGKTSLRKVVELLTTLGYEPQLDFSFQNKSATSHSRQRKRILKIGLAGFCFANIMMLSLPDYLSAASGVEQELAWVFRLIILSLSLPVFFYCASEFFVSSWNGIKSKFINIDFPIALAIAITFGRSLYEMNSGIGNGYMDSMSGIVFFMLVGRYIQERSNHSIAFDRDYKSFFPIAVQLISGKEIKAVPIEKLSVGDRILIHNQEIVPADGIVVNGYAAVDYSFVTGESDIKEILGGASIYAGAKQTGGNIEIEIRKPVSQSYLTSLWNREAFQKEKQRDQSELDKLGQYFSLVVVLLAFAAGAYWLGQNRTDLMWNALTTILIVACPCALLLAANYTNGYSLAILAKNKFYLRHADVLDAIAKTKHIVFDKTGTLTESNMPNIEFKGKPLSKRQVLRINSLAKQSSHPLSQALYHFTKSGEELELKYFKQMDGKGIEAWIDEKHIMLGSADFVGIDKNVEQDATVIYIKEDGECFGYYVIRQKYRNGLAGLLRRLKESYSLSMISGDNDQEKEHLSELFGADSKLYFKVPPERKLEYIQSLQENSKQAIMMVGDGLNDAGALKQSHVGIAVTENMNNFTPASDAVLDGSAFDKLNELFLYVLDRKKIIMIIFCYSFLYNVIGSWFALRGVLEPVIAAILMPLSSISIIALSYSFSRFAAKRRKLI